MVQHRANDVRPIEYRFFYYDVSNGAMFSMILNDP